MTDLRGSRFHDMLPFNLRSTHTQALSGALDRQMRELTDYIQKVYLLALIEKLDDCMCDLLALNYNISEYRTDMDLETKRDMIRYTFQISAQKGTSWSMERLVQTVYGPSEYEEWFDYEGDPYLFRVSSRQLPRTVEQIEQFAAAINDTKNVRSWMESINYQDTVEGTVYAPGLPHHELGLGMSIHYPQPEGDAQADLYLTPTVSHAIRRAHYRPTPERAVLDAPVPVAGRNNLYIKWEIGGIDNVQACDNQKRFVSAGQTADR